MKPRILIVYTGGTIGMIEDAATKALRPFDFSHLMENVPKVKKLDYVIDNIQFQTPIDSSDMDITHWQSIVRSIADNYDNYDGFVVLHGTDTMAYTASALSFMLQNLRKPVIITGSQLPIGEVRTDGEENLITALQIAASRDADGKPTVREVAILFENYLWRGNRSTKRSADNFNAFRSNNYPELAKIGLGIHFRRTSLTHTDKGGGLEIYPEMDTNVMAIDLFPRPQPLRGGAHACRTGHKRSRAAHIWSRQRPFREVVPRRSHPGGGKGHSDSERNPMCQRRRVPAPIPYRRQDSLHWRGIRSRHHFRGRDSKTHAPLRQGLHARRSAQALLASYFR